METVWPPLETFASDADAVPDGATAILHEIEELVGGIDDDRAGTLAPTIGHELALELWGDRIIDAVVVIRAVLVALRQGRNRAAGGADIVGIARHALSLIGASGRTRYERKTFGIAVLGPRVRIIVARRDVGVAVEIAVPGDGLRGGCRRKKDGQKHCRARDPSTHRSILSVVLQNKRQARLLFPPSSLNLSGSRRTAFLSVS
jgi:hypothetical protein